MALPNVRHAHARPVKSPLEGCAQHPRDALPLSDSQPPRQTERVVPTQVRNHAHSVHASLHHSNSSLHPTASHLDHDLIVHIAGVNPTPLPYPHHYHSHSCPSPTGSILVNKSHDDVQVHQCQHQYQRQNHLTPHPPHPRAPLPLRKKPKLTSNPISIPNSTSSHMHKFTSNPQPPVPLLSNNLPLQPPPSHKNLPSPPNQDHSSSPHPLQRANTVPLQRSPQKKKPPASNSSHGVETSCGPPASYSTQRTLSQDRPRVVERNSTRPSSGYTGAQSDASSTKPHDRPTATDLFPSPMFPVKHENATPPIADSSHGQLKTASSSIPQFVESVPAQTPLTPVSMMSKSSPMTQADSTSADGNDNLDAQDLKPTIAEDDSKGSSSDDRKSDDLFLNIAKADAIRAGPDHFQPDKRRSRISLPFFTSNRPSTSFKSSPVQSQFDTASLSARSDALNYYSKRASLGQQVPGSLTRTHQQDATIRGPHISLTQETQSNAPSDYPRRALSRRYSNANTDSSRPRPSTARNSRLVSDSTFLDRSHPPDHNATESTISTTAPSTVWDELDDLKSRIRKLELTGKLPPSSAAAMTSSDRPKTATTAATTMSSSPKNKAAVPALTSAIEGIPSQVHPLLHEALANAKSSLSSEVYQKLQATAQDALQLSMMMTSEGHSGGGSTIGVSSATERQIRRRTESMCRSLTELAIAMLADQKPASAPITRPGSRDAYQVQVGGFRNRGYSNDASERVPVISRVHSRLDGRRTSIPMASNVSHQPAGETIYQTPPAVSVVNQGSASSRIGRTSTSLRTRRNGYLDGATDDEEASPSVRPVSRAMTELGAYRQLARDRAAYSREYTAQHPLPSTLETPPVTRSTMPTNLSTNLISRRKYGSPSSTVGAPNAAPLNAKEPWGRITIVPAVSSSPIDATPDGQGNARPSNTRRSLGFTSRISSVSSRLRAVKAERNGVSDGRSTQEMAPSGQEYENVGAG
ncbi:hypothetical protein PV10_09043 [Exophiala mesophila]|uniref:Uncharacterized protein n=1 Tax=Exophiala mesophila TaxID=212818 RepID=A0A0D1YZT9_EXOME|nr:uncharacterized protein PV10_09043 [Exophiala mesophila]KIV88117.1 hypothetical protein PV10_09043 [Exophiala mesophila]